MQRRKWLLMFMLISLLITSGALVSAQDVTPEATASAPLELSQHYVSDNERVAFSYPEGWVLDLRSLREGYSLDAQLTNSSDITEQDFAIFGDGLKSGEVYMQPLVADKSALVGGMPDMTAESSIEEILQKALEVNTDENIIFGEVTSLEIDDKPAARLDVHTQKGGAGFILLIELGDGAVAGLSVGAPADELAQWESTALAIAESITFVAEPEATPEATAESTSIPVPELTQTMPSENSSVVVKYPKNWVAHSPNNNEVDIAPDPDSLDLGFGDSFKSGQVKILIQIDTTQNLIDDMQLPLEADASVEKMLQAAVKAASSAGGIEFSSVTSTVVDDEPAAFTQFSGQGFEGLAWVAEHETFARLLIQVLAAPGEAEQWKDLTLAVAEAATYPG